MRRAVVALLAGLLVVGLAACSADYDAERDGKELGQALCDIRNADSFEAAGTAVDDAREALETLRESVGLGDSEDVEAIREAASNLAESVRDRDKAAAQENVTALRTTLKQAEENASGTVQAAYSGILQGLGECD